MLAFNFFHGPFVAEVEPEAGGVVEEFAAGLKVFSFGLGCFDEADFAFIEGDDGVGGVEGERVAAKFGPGFELIGLRSRQLPVDGDDPAPVG